LLAFVRAVVSYTFNLAKSGGREHIRRQALLHQEVPHPVGSLLGVLHGCFVASDFVSVPLNCEMQLSMSLNNPRQLGQFYPA